MAKILIVDDEEGIRYTSQQFLTERGYEVSTAVGYESALDLVGKVKFDLIFIDIVLEGKTGIDLLREMKKMYSNCPIIMITGSPDVDSASEAVRLGAFDYIPKPLRQ